jgi:hypothetical protein
MIDGHWLSSNKFDPRALALYERHYSARRYADGRKRVQFVGPGEQMVLLTVCCRGLFVWIRNTIERFDHQVGVNCAVFRNEGAGLSSDLIREADETRLAALARRAALHLRRRREDPLEQSWVLLSQGRMDARRPQQDQPPDTARACLVEITALRRRKDELRWTLLLGGLGLLLVVLTVSLLLNIRWP